ncbi:MAG: GtrA family protein [Bacteroidales bacterium]|nr:GtrA family protein [Bacteroidales bacterium]
MSIKQTISNLWHSPRIHEVVRFGVVGVVATLIQYGIYYLFNTIVGLGATTSLTIGYIISFIFNFFLSNYFTFRTRPTVKKGIGFMASHGINYLLQIVFLNLYMWIGVPETLAPLPMFVTVVPINFVLVRFVLKSSKL